jgi:hypothetical protein
MNKLKTWFAENRTPAVFAAVFLALCGLAGWYAYSSWDEYSKAKISFTDASTKLANLTQTNTPPTEINQALLSNSIASEQSDLNSLLATLRQYRIPAFYGIEKAKPQDAPQLFQDALRAQVTKIKTCATTAGATLPSGFYLGLEDYENRLPTPEDTIALAKQLTVFNWISEQLIGHSGLIVAEFSKIAPPSSLQTAKSAKPLPAATASKSPPPYENPANLRVSFRCDQGSLRDILNAFSKAPYFLVIETLQLQNTVTEPPRRDTVQQQSVQATPQPTADGQTNAVQRIPIVVGREEVNASLKIRILDFPDRQQKLPATAK